MANPVNMITKKITARIDSAVSALVLEIGIKLAPPLSMVSVFNFPRRE